MKTEKVHFLNLNKLLSQHRQEFRDAIDAVLEKGSYIFGKEVDSFEKNFARWIGEGNSVVGCANGTDAITIAATAFDLPTGSEAIVPAMTFVATASALIRAGLKVRLVDVQPQTWLMDPSKLESSLTKRTRLLAPVHLYGQVAPMDEIRRLADVEKLIVLEDASQAHGARWKQQPIGYWGHAATYSFYPGKNLGAAGDAGAIASRDSNFIERCRALGNQGGLKKYEHPYVGFNSRLDTIQAAILDIKLKYIDGWNAARRKVAHAYQDQLSDLPGLELPREQEGGHHVYHLFVVLVEDRDKFRMFLGEHGIDTGIHYPHALHQLACFSDQDFASQSFPNAERVAKHGVSLPMCPTLTSQEIDRVVDVVRSYFRS